jgi:hypothetical protein
VGAWLEGEARRRARRGVRSKNREMRSSGERKRSVRKGRERCLLCIARCYSELYVSTSV